MKGLHCTPATPGQLDIARLYPQASARVSFLYSKVIKSLYHDYYPVALSRHSTRIHCLPLIMLPRRFLVTWILGTSINSNHLDSGRSSSNFATSLSTLGIRYLES